MAANLRLSYVEHGRSMANSERLIGISLQSSMDVETMLCTVVEVGVRAPSSAHSLVCSLASRHDGTILSMYSARKFISCLLQSSSMNSHSMVERSLASLLLAGIWFK